MPEYLSPGVYVEEISTGPRPIEGVGTSTAGVVGMAERGPESVKLVTSWTEYMRWYGTHDESIGYLSYAMQGFFANGGQRAFVTRIAGAGATLASADFNGEMTVFAMGRGMWGTRVRFLVQAKSMAGLYKVMILYNRNPDDLDPARPNPLDPASRTNSAMRRPDVLEVFDNLSLIPGASNHIEAVVNASSTLVRVRVLTAALAFGQVAPAPVLPPQPADPASWQLTTLAGGQDTQIIAADFAGSESGAVAGILAADDSPLLGRGWGLAALAHVDDVALLLVPDERHSNPDRHDPLEPVISDVLDQCELLQDRFAIISAPRGQTDVGNALAAKTNTRDTTYGAFYYPWIEIFDPVNNRAIRIPPSGHVTGIIARSDIERGVHKAPGNEVVRGARNLEFPVTKGMQDILNPDGVNCIRDFRPDNRGIRLWGARTLSSDGMWKYINVRRLFLFVRESIDEGMQWVVFEPNSEPTWSAVRRTASAFLERVWRDGALMGDTAEQAFFVKCDRTTMTEDDIVNGRLICEIGISPVRPAEFVIFRISQKTLSEE